ncbi:hypothetical protein [Limosilactobacillus vaginalis]|uniref:hypothetical protein n=1 Tax=Limosilactobacillus vaginalis TaxID=1633 RepID=UPI00288C3948|nr:hypothetical protein [Limosilactobacillus vaginalis]
MGLFSSREDSIAKLNDKLSGIDSELTYKKALLRLSNMSNENQTVEAMSTVVLHRDLQEIKEELHKLNEK